MGFISVVDRWGWPYWSVAAQALKQSGRASKEPCLAWGMREATRSDASLAQEGHPSIGLSDGTRGALSYSVMSPAEMREVAPIRLSVTSPSIDLYKPIREELVWGGVQSVTRSASSSPV